MTATTRRDFLKLMGLGVATCAWGGHPARAGQPTARKPNFVIQFADDQGYQDLGCFGSSRLS